MILFAVSAIFSLTVNQIQGPLNQDEIDRIFNNLTPDLIGGKDNSSLLIHNISNSVH